MSTAKIFQLTTMVLCLSLCVFGQATISNPNGSTSITAIGPEGGGAWLLVTDPQITGTVYAVTGTGVLKSVDYAGTWTTTGLTGVPPSKLSVHPRNSSILYSLGVGDSDSGKIFKSVDGGATWKDIGCRHRSDQPSQLDRD